MTDIKVDGHSMASSSVFTRSQTIVDSGTTLMLIPNQAYNGFSNYLLNMCDKGVNLAGVCGQPANESLLSGNCFALEPRDLKPYPSVTVNIKGIKTLTLTPTDYLITQVSQGTTYYCMGIQGVDSKEYIHITNSV
jgi:hypothetical protein